MEDLMLMKKVAGDGHGKQAVLCKLCILFYMSFAKSLALIPRYSCHNFFQNIISHFLLF